MDEKINSPENVQKLANQLRKILGNQNIIWGPDINYESPPLTEEQKLKLDEELGKIRKV